MWNRSELKKNAKITFKSNYWLCVLVSFILLICAGSIGGSYGGSKSFSSNSSSSYDTTSNINNSKELLIISLILGVVLIAVIVIMLLKVFVGNIFIVGGRRFYIENQIRKAPINNLVFSFKEGRYKNTLITMFLKDLYISLWCLLLLIPGIIKSYSYFMVDYIIAENPNINQKRAFEISKQTMDGQKWNAFVLDLSFIGWGILSCFTCGILSLFYVNPYADSTKAQLYLALRNIAIDKGIVSTEELYGIN